MQVSPLGSEPQCDFPTRPTIVSFAIAELVFTVLLLFTFWASYVWPLIIIIMLLVSSLVSFSHYRSASFSRFNQCCCSPDATPKSLMILSGFIVGLSIVGLVTGIVASLNYDGVTAIFAIVSCVVLFSIAVISAMKMVYLSRLQREYDAWELSRRSAMVNNGILQTTTVVAGQPIVTTQNGYMPQPVFQVYDPNQNPQYVGGYSQPPADIQPPFAANAQPYGYPQPSNNPQPYGTQPAYGYGYSN
eukprot:GILJ01033649.1.p1 GENE.GILJ01033649.1~~GILJ01033649.1.p1  ORF type:complete len:245 (-),score=11.52 GILJ01033649.1:55-789(-)